MYGDLFTNKRTVTALYRVELYGTYTVTPILYKLHRIFNTETPELTPIGIIGRLTHAAVVVAVTELGITGLKVQ